MTPKSEMSSGLIVIFLLHYFQCLKGAGRRFMISATIAMLIPVVSLSRFPCMITQKMKYALKALLTLADEAAKEVPEALTIEAIAKRSGTPKRFLEHILLEVRNAGVIASTRGRSGGYQLIKPPAEVSISEMLRLIDGPIAPLGCLSRRAYQRCEDCTDEDSCRIRRIFADVFWTYLLLIESLTLADMLRSSAVADQILGAPIPA
jgi:Rrf2 family protein